MRHLQPCTVPIAAMDVKQIRERKAATIRWTKEAVDILLSDLKTNLGTIERPTARIFYNAMIAKHAVLHEYTWEHVRNKVRNLKTKYKAAIDWRDQTGSELLEQGEADSVNEYLLKLCPEFKELDELFGCKSDVILPNSQEERQSEPVNKYEESLIKTPVIKKQKLKYENNSLMYLAEIQKSRLELLSEKLKLDQLIHQDNVHNKTMELEVEREKLLLERKRIEEDSRIRQLEIEKKMELQRLQMEQELELKKYELKLKYNVPI